MVSGVLFDLDGTLLDCIVPMERIFIRVVESLGFMITAEKRNEAAANLRRILLHGSAPFDGIRLLWRIGHFIGMPPHRRIAMILLTYRALRDAFLNSPLLPGAEDVLRTLKKKGFPIVIVTTRSAKEALHVLRRHSLEGYFDLVVSRDQVRRGKPYPDPVLFALKRIDLDPREAVMIGDMPTDIEAGKAAGTKTLGVAAGIFNEELRRSQPDAIVSSLYEIPEVLERL
ncbi:MAG: HAD family hydrolase [Candidatus Methanosuratincola sp.]